MNATTGPWAELRRIGVPDSLTVCRLLPVEGFLVWSLRAWTHSAMHGESDLKARSLRWYLHERFLSWGIVRAFQAFDVGVRAMVGAATRDIEVHTLDCVCVGNDERRWLHAIGSLQRSHSEAAARSLAPFLATADAWRICEAFAPVATSLNETGWMVPPWTEATAEARTRHDGRSLKLIVTHRDV